MEETVAIRSDFDPLFGGESRLHGKMIHSSPFKRSKQVCLIQGCDRWQRSLLQLKVGEGWEISSYEAPFFKGPY